MSSLIFLVAIFASAVLGHPPKCYLRLSPGTDKDCNDSPSQRFHFDPKMNQCHTFQYNGCGGNGNNYKTAAECAENCDVDPKTYIQCPLGTSPIFNSQGNSDCTPSDPETGEGCESSDAYCVSFLTMGLCCNRTVVTGLVDDKSTTCPSGNSRWQMDGISVLAKSCEDLTCPDGYSCQDGNFFSYCCENTVSRM